MNIKGNVINKLSSVRFTTVIAVLLYLFYIDTIGSIVLYRVIFDVHFVLSYRGADACVLATAAFIAASVFEAILCYRSAEKDGSKIGRHGLSLRIVLTVILLLLSVNKNEVLRTVCACVCGAAFVTPEIVLLVLGKKRIRNEMRFL